MGLHLAFIWENSDLESCATSGSANSLQPREESLSGNIDSLSPGLMVLLAIFLLERNKFFHIEIEDFKFLVFAGLMAILA
jgi:hypothetical protein